MPRTPEEVADALLQAAGVCRTMKVMEPLVSMFTGLAAEIRSMTIPNRIEVEESKRQIDLLTAHARMWRSLQEEANRALERMTNLRDAEIAAANRLREERDALLEFKSRVEFCHARGK